MIRYKREIAKQLLHWFNKNMRPLPWRIKRDWYKVWISEVMLQQTQVKQVLPYYHRFLKKFPNVYKLAQASEQEILKIWEGLGYYSRVRNLHRTAKIIVDQYEGEIPREKNELIKLPGFGPYITNAMLSIAFKECVPVVDGNVLRVISRLFTIVDDIRENNTKKKIYYYMKEIIDLNSPADFNEAVMELGATLCTPENPLCAHCPVSDYCQAFKKDHVDRLPFKSKAKSKPHIGAHSFVIRKDQKYLLAKRPQNGLLAGLWEFPTYNLKKDPYEENATPDMLIRKLGISGEFIKSLNEIRHSYTHFKLYLTPHLYYYTGNNSNITFYEQLKWLTVDSIKHLPVHGVMQKTLHSLLAELKIVT
jgi:A/G-specific adenine glycosylase